MQFVSGILELLCLLLQAKWNDGLLEMFRNEYIGSAPYISSEPFLCHHKLCPDDQFLVLSSDGLYQYLSNEEVVSHVEHFMENFPDGDPAQSLIEELLSRAAKKAGICPLSLCQFYSTVRNLCTHQRLFGLLIPGLLRRVFMFCRGDRFKL